MTSNTSNAESPRPTVARTGRWAKGLEQIVARTGFQLPNYSHANSPARDAPEEILTAIERFRISDPLQQPMPSSARFQGPPSYESLFDKVPLEQHLDNCPCPYHQIDGDSLLAEADAAEQADRDTAALRDNAWCGATGGRVQSRVINEHGAQARGGTLYDSNVGQEREELRAERAKELLGAEGQMAFGRTPRGKTSTTKPAERASPPSATLCKPGGKSKKGGQEQNRAKRARVGVLAANDHRADTNPRTLNTGDWPTIQEWQSSSETAKCSVTAHCPSSIAGDKPGSNGHNANVCGAAQDNVLSSSNSLFSTPPPLKKRWGKKAAVNMTTPTGDQLAWENGDEREMSYNTLCNGMVEVCDMFSQFDSSVTHFTTDPARAGLRQLMKKLERTKQRPGQARLVCRGPGSADGG